MDIEFQINKIIFYEKSFVSQMWQLYNFWWNQIYRRPIVGLCKKQFSIRIGKSKLKATRKEEILDEQANKEDFGSIVVVENVFGYKQVLPLMEGDNLIGRRSKGTEVDIPIETSDPSMDRRHCIINVKRNKQGEVIYTLRDNDSITGTFLMNEILGNKDRIRIEEGAIITLGATTLILRATEK